MNSVLNNDLNAEQISRLGLEILRSCVEPLAGSAATGKFVAIDIDSRLFEISEDDIAAIMRLRDRAPQSRIFLGRVGETSACRVG